MKPNKPLSRLLVVLLLLCAMLLAACSNTEQPPADTTGGTGDGAGPGGTGGTGDTDRPGEPETPEGNLTIIENGSSEYIIVIAEEAQTWERNAALTFKDTIEDLTGVTIKIKTDNETPVSKEIIFGKTNRESLFEADYDSFNMGYRIFSSGERLIVLGGSPAGMHDALARFFSDYYEIDLDTWEPAPSEYPDLYINGGYMIRVNYTSAELPYIGVPLKDYTLVYNSADTLQVRYGVLLKEFIASITNETVPVSDTELDGGKNLILKVDPEVTPTNFRVSVSGTDISVSFANYYGFYAAREWLQQEFADGQFFSFEDGFAYEGSYEMFLDKTTASTAYAFKRAGTYRVMFNNVLWGSSSGGEGRPQNDVPALERNTLTAAMAALYQPDVFGLQEYSENGTQGAIKGLLEDLGYTAIYFADRGDGTPVSTPLFYRADSVTLLESGFRVFENQPIQKDLSKSVTWGVFEADGSRFIVASVHFCTQDKEIGALQVGELLTLVGGLQEEYGCTAIIGGDYNSTVSEATYQALASAGYSDAHTYAAESIDVRTNQWYPKFDTDAGIMKPDLTAVNTDAAGSVDHIMLSDLSNFSIDLFGVVVDDVTLSASDHLPVFIDFSNQDNEWTERY